MGQSVGQQDRLFYEFNLEERVPAGHLLRRINAVLDLSWLRGELAPYYSHTGCPSIDPSSPFLQTKTRFRESQPNSYLNRVLQQPQSNSDMLLIPPDRPLSCPRPDILDRRICDGARSLRCGCGRNSG